jgi:regulatory protein
MAARGGDDEEKAFQRAVRFLSYRARSKLEVRNKLAQAGFAEKIVEAALAKLRSLELLNDEAFARGWVRGRVEGRGYGPLRVERELRRKGIHDSLIQRVMDEFFASDQVEANARSLLERRFRGQDLRDRKILHRAVSFLQRRGYRNSVIAAVVRSSLDD